VLDTDAGPPGAWNASASDESQFHVQRRTMKAKALGIAAAVLLAALSVVSVAGADVGTAQRLKTCDPTNFPNALVWLKVEWTSCATGKETTRRMRAYMQQHPGAAGEDGWFHHEIDGWKCKARFVGGDEVIERCRKPRKSNGSRLIRALFYID